MTKAALSAREREVADLVVNGLSNKAIGQRLFISEKTVEKTVTSIYQKLGITKRVQLVAQMSAAPQRDSRIGYLPTPLSPFIGRTDELDDLRKRVAENRLVVLTGAGGSGKTRLAIEYARRNSGTFVDGAWFVDVAALVDAGALLPTIATTLSIARDPGKDTHDAVLAWLSDRHALLILDNCEQFAKGLGAVLREMLGRAPHLQLIVTSRRRLGVFNESVIRMGAMQLPDAIAFLADRARSAGADEAEPDLAQRICRRLDCVPLAIELAAARLYEMSPEQLDRALATHPEVLRSDDEDMQTRHRSIDDLVDWGYRLLEPQEQRLFRGLAVFSGSFSTDVLGELYGTTATVGVHALHRISLVERLPLGRYRMLQVVRDVAARLLREADEEAGALAAFASYYGALLETAYRSWLTSPIATWLEPLRAEDSNILAAIDWALIQGNDIPGGVAMTAAAARVWNEMARETEFERYLQAAIEREEAATTGARTRLWLARARSFDVDNRPAEALVAAQRAFALAQQGDDELDTGFAILAIGCSYAAAGDPQAAPMLERALSIFRPRGVGRSIATALTALAFAVDDAARRIALFEEVHGIAKALDNRLLEAITLSNIAESYVASGENERSLEPARTAAAIFQGLGARTRLGRGQLTLAKSEYLCGHFDRALQAACGAFTIFADSTPGGLLYRASSFIAEICAEGHPEVAARAFGFAQHVRERIGESTLDDGFRTLLIDRLGSDLFGTLCTQGARTSAVDLCAAALALIDQGAD